MNKINDNGRYKSNDYKHISSRNEIKDDKYKGYQYSNNYEFQAKKLQPSYPRQ